MESLWKGYYYSGNAYDDIFSVYVYVYFTKVTDYCSKGSTKASNIVLLRVWGFFYNAIQRKKVEYNAI